MFIKSEKYFGCVNVLLNLISTVLLSFYFGSILYNSMLTIPSDFKIPSYFGNIFETSFPFSSFKSPEIPTDNFLYISFVKVFPLLVRVTLAIILFRVNCWHYSCIYSLSKYSFKRFFLNFLKAALWAPAPIGSPTFRNLEWFPHIPKLTMVHPKSGIYQRFPQITF